MPYTKTVRESPVLGHEKRGQTETCSARPPHFRLSAIAFYDAVGIHTTAGLDLRRLPSATLFGSEQT